MEPNTGALPIIAEVGIGFVGFSTIVAVLRQTFGSQLSSFQILLIHFYIETGLLNVAMALLPIGLFSLLDSEPAVWRASTLVILIVLFVYLPTYIWRRRAVHAPNPVISWVVMIGYAVSGILLIVTLTEVYWQPSLAVTTAYLFWAFCSSAAIFIYFLGTFLRGGNLSS